MSDRLIITKFKCAERAKGTNKRFEDKITSKDVLSGLKMNDFKCFYCNDKIDYRNWQLDHFNPRANGGLNKRENLVACCKWCNIIKNALDGNAFINKCFNIVNNNFFALNNIENRLEDKEINYRVSKIKKKIKKLNLEFNDELIIYLKDSFMLKFNNKNDKL